MVWNGYRLPAMRATSQHQRQRVVSAGVPGHEGAVRMSVTAEQHNEGRPGWAGCKPTTEVAMTATPDTRTETTAAFAVLLPA